MAKTLIIISGPTGIGKTETGIALAQHLHTEIISADSRQIFKELTIGTAVPTKSELQSVRHHFIHSHSIHENYNASKFETEVLMLLNERFEQFNEIVMVGGSMLYIEAICKGIDNIPDADPEIRQSLKNQLKKGEIESLRLQLKMLDPEYYYKVDLKNTARIIHALEICLMTGKPFSAFLSNQKKERPFRILKIGLNCDRDELHRRINKRVDKMVEAGLEKEARSVYHLRFLNALNTVGYREWFAFFDGEITREKAIELIKRNSRRYARKQLTWFRKDPEMHWFEPQQTTEIIKYIESKINSK
ncbi:MAG TPA: tRNA (adenosine(37)-N6)-dimethylallyltransferase MiaA [Draconibacterium sp.]|nr:tRNA (adenosine(37)-N6)-dimethylallyltransferase MiaA [Draconibacterium sp.]